jgi:hypothetical protein
MVVPVRTWRAWLVIAAMVIGLGVWPVWAQRDSYPHSNLPMFASPRTRAEPVTTAVAARGEGDNLEVWRLGPRRLAGTDEVISAGATVRRAVAEGTVAVLCAEIATRVAAMGPGEAERIEIVTERYDAVEWFQGRREPLERLVHHRCDVGVPAS